MSNKITLRDLTEALVVKNGGTKSFSESFIRNFFDLIKLNLDKDNYVKVKGLGTFKLMTMSERESVDVNTGDRIEIPEYSRVVFTSDKSLSQRINRPFENFSTVIIDGDEEVENSFKKEDEEEMDSKDTLHDSELKIVKADYVTEIQEENEIEFAVENSAIVVKDQQQDKNVQEDNRNEIVNHSVEKEKIQSGVEQTFVSSVYLGENTEGKKTNGEILVENKEDILLNLVQEKDREKISNRRPEEVMQKSPVLSDNEFTSKDETMTADFSDEKPAANKHRKIKVIAILVVFLFLFVSSYFIGYYHLFGNTDIYLPNFDFAKKMVSVTSISKSPVVTHVSKTKTNMPKVVTQHEVEKMTTASKNREQMVLQQKALHYEQMKSGEYLIIGTQEVHKMKEGESLIKLSKKIYGDKEMAKYVIFYNGFEHPDLISVGTKIRFPKLIKRIN